MKDFGERYCQVLRVGVVVVVLPGTAGSFCGWLVAAVVVVVVVLLPGTLLLAASPACLAASLASMGWGGLPPKSSNTSSLTTHLTTRRRLRSCACACAGQPLRQVRRRQQPVRAERHAEKLGHGAAPQAGGAHPAAQQAAAAGANGRGGRGGRQGRRSAASGCMAAPVLWRCGPSTAAPLTIGRSGAPLRLMGADCCGTAFGGCR